MLPSLNLRQGDQATRRPPHESSIAGNSTSEVFAAAFDKSSLLNTPFNTKNINMPRELDNAAPEIYATAGTGREEGLWADAFEDPLQPSDEEREEIDSQEVFGKFEQLLASGGQADSRPYTLRH